MALTLTGCGVGQVADAVKEATNVIDNGIRDISANSSAWQVILQRVAAELPKEISETIRLDAQSLANRSIATAGVEFRCNVDFLGAGDRVAASAQVEAARWDASGAAAELLPGGSRLDRSQRGARALVGADAVRLRPRPSGRRGRAVRGVDAHHGRTHDPLPEAQIGRTTHDQVTVNIGGMGPTMHQQHVAKFVVSWDGKTSGYPEAVVIAPRRLHTHAAIPPAVGASAEKRRRRRRVQPPRHSYPVNDLDVEAATTGAPP